MKPAVSSWYFNFAAFFAGFGSFAYMLSIPIHMDRLYPNDYISIGIVITSYSIAVLIFSPLWGYLSDKASRRKPFLVGGYLLFAVGGVLMTFSETVPQMMAARFLMGVGFAAHPMVTALFSDYYGQNATKKFGMLSGSEAFGWGLGGLIAGLLADYVGISLGFSILAFLPFMSLLIIALKLPEVEPEKSKSDKPETRPAFPKKLFYLYGTVFLRMSSAIALWTLMPIYLQEFVGNNITLVGVVTSVNMLIQPFFMVLIGKHAERLGRLRLVIWGIIGTVITFWLYASAPNLIPILIGQLTISLSWAAIMIGMNTYIMTTAPLGTRGKAFGYLTSSITLAMALGPMLGTGLADQFEIRGMIFIVSFLMLLSLPFVVYLRMKDQRGLAAS